MRLVRWGRPLLVTSILALVAACGSSDDSDDPATGADAGDSTDDEHHEHDMDDDGLAELMADHEHHVSDEPLDQETQELLDTQLEATQDLIDAYPTLADAEADGWQRAGQFSPGLGTHYIKDGETFTIRSSEESEQGEQGEEGEDVQPLLMFDGLGPESPIAGLMLLAIGDSEPDGFAGPNDYWHRHTNVCLIQREDALEAPFGADVDDVTEEMCTDVGGSYLDVTTHMLHVWTVPGYESEMGVFGGVSSQITCPDGTYHMVAVEELDASTTESVCLN